MNQREQDITFIEAQDIIEKEWQEFWELWLGNRGMNGNSPAETELTSESETQI